MKEKKPINVEIGQNIKKIREDAGLTQDAFSELLGLGEKHVSAIECGATGVSLPTLKKICSLLSISSDMVLFGSAGGSEQNEREDAVRLLSDRLSRLPDNQFWEVKELIDRLLIIIATNR